MIAQAAPLFGGAAAPARGTPMRFVTRQTTVRSGVVTTQVSLNGKLIGSITKTRNRPGCVYPYRAFGADGESGFGYLGEFESRKLALAAILEACPS